MTYMDIRYSKDGGYTWSSWRRVPMGVTGQFAKRITQRGFGRGYQFVFHTRVSDPVKADMVAASYLPEQMDG